ncbi:MAG: hypothetical protein HYX92_15375 [Chloroflexi bacterium]|nr:hypothetical protein [Chloroflexota bacterium]
MLRIETRTKMTPEAATQAAVSFFGPEGLGLTVRDRRERCVQFEGGGGLVEVSTCEDGKATKVEVTSQEWDAEVKEFVRKIGSGR